MASDARPTPTLLKSRLSTLLKQMPAAQAGDETSVHQARVASRRLREVLPVAGADEQQATRRALKQVRRVTRALGPVREIDVALGHLAEYAAKGITSDKGIHQVRLGLERARRARRREMLAILSPGQLHKLEKRFEAFDETAATEEVRTVILAEATRRVVSRAARLREAIDRAGAIYLADRLHAVRIAAKKLRYAVEIQRELTRSRATARVKQLKDVQEHLGRLHDLEILMEHTRAVQARTAATDRRTATDLDALVRALEDECRSLHAAYVVRRTALVKLCDALASMEQPAPPTAA